MTAHTIAIDIGTTNTRVAAVGTRELSRVSRVDFSNAEFDDQFVPAIKAVLSARPHIHTVNISSCVKHLANRAVLLCENERSFDGINIIKPHGDVILLKQRDMQQRSIQIRYDIPLSLGTDRLCNALACSAMFRERSCVIIDAGTAITVDLLRGGAVFEGGAILPGVSMQLSALHEHTDGLPLVNICGGGSPVGTSTENCVNSGVLYGTAGAVEKIVNEYLKAADDEGALTIATGGGWEIIAPFIDHKIAYVPDLTLIGAALYSPALGR